MLLFLVVPQNVYRGSLKVRPNSLENDFALIFDYRFATAMKFIRYLPSQQIIAFQIYR